MKTINIALIEGDGIGPEVCQAARIALEAATPSGFQLQWNHAAGGAGHFLKTGVALPEDTIEQCRNADAILLGAVGLPSVVRPDGTEAGQDVTLNLRTALQLYANIRPIRSLPKTPHSSSTPEFGSIDYVIVRENCEGLYASRTGGIQLQDQCAIDNLVVSRKGVERITRTAAELCLSRNGALADGKRRVTICDKSNVLKSYAFFRSVAEQTLTEYPDIEVETTLIDAQSMFLVTQPTRYDVIVTENMFGDILSDLGAATIGGLGLAPSAEIGDKHGLFQGSHGSAPDIAGQGLANPIATILSGGLMLEWLGRKWSDMELIKAAESLRQAVESAMETGASLTPDTGGTSSTLACGQAIADRIKL